MSNKTVSRNGNLSSSEAMVSYIPYIDIIGLTNVKIGKDVKQWANILSEMHPMFLD